MNLDEMQNAWNSPQNQLPTAQQRQLAERFTNQMRRRRRFQGIWLANTFVALSVVTGLAVRSIALEKTNSMQEWALFPLVLIPWTFAIVFLMRFLKPRNSKKLGELPIADSLQAALASNQSSQTNLKWVAVLYAIIIPVLALSMHQLQAAGKVSERELVSMIAFFGSALLFSGTAVALRFFAGLRPQERKLRELINELTGEPA